MSRPDDPNRALGPRRISRAERVGSGDALAKLEIDQDVFTWREVLTGSPVLQGRNVSTLVTDPFHVALGYSVSDDYHPLAGHLLLPGPRT